jgi:diguanylate cyclase (GGDEF)-like protein/PAS domain S-box-containing protein
MATFLKTKRLGWAIVFLLVTAVGLLSYFSGRRYVAAMSAVEHTLALQSAIHGVLSSLKDAETAQRGYNLTGDVDFLEPHATAVRELPALFDSLSTLAAGDDVQVARLARLRSLTDQKLAYVAESIRVRQSDDVALARQRVRSGQGKAIMDQVRSECRSMLEHEERRLQQRKQEAQRAEVAGEWGVGVGSVLTIALSLFSLLTVQRDVDELKRTAEDLAKSEEYYRLLTEHSNDLVRLMSLSGKVSYVSPSVEHLLGYTVREYLDLSPLALLHPDEIDSARELLQKVVSGESSGGISNYRLRHNSGEYRWFEVHWSVRKDAQGKPVDLHLSGRDVTERRAAEAQLNAYADQLKTLSLRDELTGLYNRRGFLEVAAQAHSLARRDGRPAALVFMDLNGMKRINDEHGHDIGDLALVDTADVLLLASQSTDVVARLGGDEFVVFALDFTEVELVSLRARLRELADARVAESGRPFRISMSVGAAYLPVGSTLSLQQLLESADQAMYEQKNRRRAAGNVSLAPPPRLAPHKLS